jgi:hypothetical protein
MKGFSNLFVGTLVSLLLVSSAFAQCMRCTSGAVCQGGYSSGGTVCYTESLGGEQSCWTSGRCSVFGDPGGPLDPYSASGSSRSSQDEGLRIEGHCEDGKGNVRRSAGLTLSEEEAAVLGAQAPLISRAIRVLTKGGLEPILLGEIPDAVVATLNSKGVMEEQYRMYGFVEGADDLLFIELNFVGHPELASVKASLDRTSGSLRASIESVALDGSERTNEL